MISIAFPNILNDTHTNLVKDHQATVSNLMLVLMSTKNSLFGDPYFGSNIQKLMFEQNDVVLKDIVIDDIYSAIKEFVPQLQLSRNDISIVQTRTSIDVSIRATNLIDYQTDLFTINLIGSDK